MKDIEELQEYIGHIDRKIEDPKGNLYFYISLILMLGLVCMLLLFGTLGAIFALDGHDSPWTAAIWAFGLSMFPTAVIVIFLLRECKNRIKESKLLQKESIYLAGKRILEKFSAYQEFELNFNNVRAIANAISGDQKALLERVLRANQPELEARRRVVESYLEEWIRLKRVPPNALDSLGALIENNDADATIEKQGVKEKLQDAAKELEARVELESHILRLPIQAS